MVGPGISRSQLEVSLLLSVVWLCLWCEQDHATTKDISSLPVDNMRCRIGERSGSLSCPARGAAASLTGLPDDSRHRCSYQALLALTCRASQHRSGKSCLSYWLPPSGRQLWRELTLAQWYWSNTHYVLLVQERLILPLHGLFATLDDEHMCHSAPSLYWMQGQLCRVTGPPRHP